MTSPGPTLRACPLMTPAALRIVAFGSVFGYGSLSIVGGISVLVGSKRDKPQAAPVKASWDRIIRTTVGLRPHRDAGFVLKADKLDDKLLVHNYGHGGAGMSLAWGTGLMAAEFATERGYDRPLHARSRMIRSAELINESSIAETLLDCRTTNVRGGMTIGFVGAFSPDIIRSSSAAPW